MAQKAFRCGYLRADERQGLIDIGRSDAAPFEGAKPLGLTEC
jgi:hypothetical protein